MDIKLVSAKQHKAQMFLLLEQQELDRLLNSLDTHGVSKERLPRPSKSVFSSVPPPWCPESVSHYFLHPLPLPTGGREIPSRHTIFWLIDPEALNRFLLSHHKPSAKKQPLGKKENLDTGIRE